MANDRYKAVWRNGQVQVLDRVHGDLPAANVYLHKTVNGTGWRVMRNTQGKNSRSLHPSPEEAIYKIGMMRLSSARRDLAESEAGPEGAEAAAARAAATVLKSTPL